MPTILSAENGSVLNNQHERDQNPLNGNVDIIIESECSGCSLTNGQLKENTKQCLHTVVN